LGRSVIIFADDQKEKLSDIEALPLLNDKPYAYFDPETGEEERGVYSFEFVTDQYESLALWLLLVSQKQQFIQGLVRCLAKLLVMVY